MKKLFTSTLLTITAVPFLMAAPTAAKKVQNQAPAASTSQTTTAKAKTKKVKKAKKTATDTAAPAAQSK